MRFSPGDVSRVRYDAMITYLDEMKGIYQKALDAQASDGNVTGSSLVKAREHLRCLELLEETVRQHHEMDRGSPYRQGKTRGLKFKLNTVAQLILPDGSVRKLKGNEHE